MNWRGFTIVELVITITIMGILLTLAVVSLNSSQANARDSERVGDVEAIALNLEAYYKNASEDALGTTYASGNTYPGTNFITPATLSSSLPDIDPKSIRAPNVDATGPISLVPATNNVQTASGILPRPSQTNDVYVYQPIDGTRLCTTPSFGGECKKFNIYYYQETTDTVQQITSKNQ